MSTQEPQARAPRLLVLGAGLDQCFMLRCAREMGIETFAVDANPAAPGFAWADCSAVVSNRDVPAILACLEHRRSVIDGVATMGSDIPHVVAAVARALELPSIPLAAAQIAVDKFRMKETFRRAGVAVPDYRLVESPEELVPLLAEWQRLVVKPLSQAGSRGVSLVSSPAGLAPAYAQARRFADGAAVLAERFLPGDQISSESLIVDGEVHTPGLADRNYDELARFLPQIMENGGWVPSRHLAERTEIDALIGRCAAALGIRNGVLKGDLVREPDGRIAVIEVAARLSGGDFSESLVPIATGVNYVKQVIRQALGWPVELAALRPVRSLCVANRYFFAPPGHLRGIEVDDALRTRPWLEKLEFWFSPGDRIPPLEGHGQRAGVFIVSGPDRRTVSRRIAQVEAAIRFDVEGHGRWERPAGSPSLAQRTKATPHAASPTPGGTT